MSSQSTPILRLAVIGLLLAAVNLSYAQHFPRTKSILESPDGTYSMIVQNHVGSLESIAESLQPKKNKRKFVGDEVTLSMSFRVYQQAAVGNRPFAKIRYKIHLKKIGEDLTCTFSDFNFKQYERSARYGRMIEEKGKGRAIQRVEESLNEIQWGTVRWRMDQEVGKYLNRMLAFESAKTASPTTERDR